VRAGQLSAASLPAAHAALLPLFESLSATMAEVLQSHRCVCVGGGGGDVDGPASKV
jgi:hypothetical protein